MKTNQELFAGFAADQPDLLKLYLYLVSTTLIAEAKLRDLNEKCYSDVMLRSQRQSDAASAAAHAAFREATHLTSRAHRKQCDRLQAILNEKITAANVVFQAAESPARAGVNKLFVALDQRRTAMLFAASELSVRELHTRADREYQEGRAALLAEIDARIAPARAVYDAAIKGMHDVHLAQMRAADTAYSAFEAPFVAARQRRIEAARVEHGFVSGTAYMARHRITAALDQYFHTFEQERLDWVVNFCQAFEADGDTAAVRSQGSGFGWFVATAVARLTEQVKISEAAFAAGTFTF